MKNELFFGGKVILCAEEENDNDDVYRAKFVISDFSVNHNNVQLNRKTINKWIKTLIHKPLVGKIVNIGYGEKDFSGHNLRVVYRKDEDGNRYKDSEFDTNAFGTFTDVGIEKIDGNECIVAKCEIWKRFTNACALILKRMEEGTLSTSWEITPMKVHYTVSGSKKVKVIDDGVFTAHCLLGSHVNPAYDCSKMLEVAETTPDFDTELADALGQDVQSLEKDIEEKEVVDMNMENVKNPLENKVENTAEMEVSEEKKPEEDSKKENKKADENKEDKDDPDGQEDDNSPADENKESKEDDSDNKKDKKKESAAEEKKSAEVSELTSNDIYKKICNEILKGKSDSTYDCYPSFIFPEAHEVWCKPYGGDYTDTDMIRYTYSVNGDSVAISEPENVKLSVSVVDLNSTIAELNKNLASAAQEIQENKKIIAELTVYKEKVEQAEREKIEAEMAEKKEQLRGYAISSGLIEMSEISDSGELANAIDSIDENAINMVIAERYMKKHADEKKPKTEVSEKKNRAEVNEVKRTPYYTDNDIKNIMRDYMYGKQ